MEVLSFIEVIIINGRRYFPKNCSRQVFMLVWADYDPADVYLKLLAWYSTQVLRQFFISINIKNIKGLEAQTEMCSP